MTTRMMVRRAGVLALAVAVLAAGVPSALAAEDADAEPMSDAEFERVLSEMQSSVDAAVAAYEGGDRAAALEEARSVKQRFGFDGGGASALERKLKAVSAVAIGDQVKAHSARLVTAIESNASVAEVQGIGEDLAPSLNRLVLVAQGKSVPASQRDLRTPDAIQAAADEVLEQVNEAVSLYRQGDASGAKAAAEEAFFTYETNGLGPDTSTVDDDLENEVENAIVNFDESTVDTDPGLSQLIEQGAPLADVEAQADVIRNGTMEIVELLQSTLPPLDLGDANQDGKVSIVDALLVAQAALGIRADDASMDANQDGRVSIVDALLVAQAALGIRSL